MTPQQEAAFPEIPDFMAGSVPVWLKDTAAVMAWLGLVALVLAVWIARTRRGSPARRWMTVNVLLVYAVAASFTVGLSRKELWPFSAWSMLPDVRAPVAGHVRVFGVDEGGREYAVDYRAWHPLQWEELMAWLDLRFVHLSVASRDSAAAHLLDWANAARAKVLRGEQPGYLDRFLGPLAAPEHMLHPIQWTSPADLPESPFVGIRIVREGWNVDEGPYTREGVTRQYLHEFSRAGS